MRHPEKQERQAGIKPPPCKIFEGKIFEGTDQAQEAPGTDALNLAAVILIITTNVKEHFYFLVKLCRPFHPHSG